jgi:hypothetical protein
MKKQEAQITEVTKASVEVYLPSRFKERFAKGDDRKLNTSIKDYCQLLYQSLFNEKSLEIEYSLNYTQEKDATIRINNNQCRLANQIRKKPPNLTDWSHVSTYCCEGIFQNRLLLLTNERVEEIILTSDNEFDRLSFNDKYKICCYLIKYCHSLSRFQTVTNLSKSEDLKDPSDCFELIVNSLDALSLKIDLAFDLQNSKHPADEYSLEDVLNTMNDGLFKELGIYCPQPELSINNNLLANQFQIWLNDLPLPIYYTLSNDYFLCNRPSENINQNISNPGIYNHANFADFSIREIKDLPTVKEIGYTWGTAGVIVLHLSRIIRENSGVWVNINVTKAIFEKIENAYFLKELFLKRFDLIYLTKVLRKLSSEAVTLRHINKILETLISAGDFMELDNSKIEFLPDLNVLSLKKGEIFDAQSDWQKMGELMRKALREEFSIQLTNQTYKLNVFLIDRVLENSLIFSDFENSNELKKELINSLSTELEGLSSSTMVHCILVSDLARRIIQEAIEIEYPFLKVVSYRELSPSVHVTPIATLTPRIGSPA